jgi:L-seryl-tRNA(Ser) seleniumtransferase
MDDVSELRKLPSVDELLKRPVLAELADKAGRELAVFAVREAIAGAREKVRDGSAALPNEELAGQAAALIRAIAEPSLKPVINATGVILHTNLGRAPLGPAVLADMAPVIQGYSNLEFDCGTASRGSRNSHLAQLLRFVTGAEETLVVNNNAAALVLVLNSFARGKEVIVSRGELIEIGGEFRIPEIMRAGGARMVEVGTTNRTRLGDYERAVTPKTALLFKAHKSNFAISGFTGEVSVAALARLARRSRIPLVYDIGSGLLRRPQSVDMKGEPDVRTALEEGADLVTFSGDKLLGGPQAGIIAGRAELVKKLAKAPLMRALRVGKLTIAGLSSVCRSYIKSSDLTSRNQTFGFLGRSREQILGLASKLQALLHDRGVNAAVVESRGQCGGGSLPGLFIDSAAVKLVFEPGKDRKKHTSAERVFRKLLDGPRPVLGVLREGDLVFDLLTVEEEELPGIAAAIARAAAAEARQ